VLTMRSILLAAAAALAMATVANAASVVTGPFTVDAKGGCHGKSNGKSTFVARSYCSKTAPAAPPAAAPVCKAGVSKVCGKGCIPLAAKCTK
jgi:hypothetical protein